MVTAVFVSHQARLALVAAEAELKAPFADELPSRQEQLAALQNTQEFDVLVVGGGATGVGCALDAVTRSEFPVNAEESHEKHQCTWRSCDCSSDADQVMQENSGASFRSSKTFQPSSERLLQS